MLYEKVHDFLGYPEGSKITKNVHRTKTVLEVEDVDVYVGSIIQDSRYLSSVALGPIGGPTQDQTDMPTSTCYLT